MVLGRVLLAAAIVWRSSRDAYADARVERLARRAAAMV
jgi:hypothetical protein